MQVTVNAKPIDIDQEATLASLIQSLQLDPRILVAEVNAEIVPRDQFEARTLAPEDRIELVRLVGGG
ncbi:MAG: sulfur carrier protein ThiS [Planctomycetota bacterium]